jgi:hypothetical protein
VICSRFLKTHFGVGAKQAEPTTNRDTCASNHILLHQCQPGQNIRYRMGKLWAIKGDGNAPATFFLQTLCRAKVLKTAGY